MTVIWFISWLVAGTTAGHLPVGDAWTGTLILAFAVDISVLRAWEIGKISADASSVKSRGKRAAGSRDEV